MKRIHKRSLSLSIFYDRDKHAFRIIIDGDIFWADTYEHAICKLTSILMRDEINYRLS